MTIDEAMRALMDRLVPVGVERAELSEAAGRVLAETIVADRPSPPVNVSAMDGVAIRLEDVEALASRGLPVAGEAAVGRSAPNLPTGAALWIFTGGPVPTGADAVVQREWLIESPGEVRLAPHVDADAITRGMHIRRQGENARAGDALAQPGVLITPALLGALASVGAVRPLVRQRVRVAIIVTGDELSDAGAAPAPTGLRDSNGPAVASLLGAKLWIDVVSRRRVRDRLDDIRVALAHACQRADCIITTGGVSMGNHDHVPAAAAALDAETIFHRLAIKPGKPVFAARCANGPLLLGLPGNPVSALVTAKRIALPAIARLAGAPASVARPEARAQLQEPLDHPSPITRFALVERCGVDTVRLMSNRGSGDLAAAARSDGFVQIPANDIGDTPVDYYSWSGA